MITIFYRLKVMFLSRLARLRTYLICLNTSKIHKSVKFYGINELHGVENITIGERSGFRKGLFLTAWPELGPAKIQIGKNCWFGAYCHITSINSITIGDNCLTGKWVTITDNSHGTSSIESLTLPPTLRANVSKGPVIIGNNVWIGEKATILPNVSIGDGAVVAANSVVTKSVPKYSVVAGNPAKIIRQNEFKEYETN